MARIVTVYNNWKKPFVLIEMGYIRWLKVSQALARLGHQVDMATNETAWDETQGRDAQVIHLTPNLRRIPLASVQWSEYDVVKTLFHAGFDTLEAYGGTHHPFIISKLGSVVGPVDMPGIYFHGTVRERLYATQRKISQTSRYVTLLSKPAKALWETCFGRQENILLVPGAVDSVVPPPSRDPFPQNGHRRCIFAGNIYFAHAQPEANVVLVDKLNRLGKLLKRRDIRLYMLGTGDVSKLDRDCVSYVGAVPYEQTWDYLHYAHVGIVVSAGTYMHNNESTKIYHYLRVGLPIVSEAGFPNDSVIEESQLGFVVENGNLEVMAEKIVEAAGKNWEREQAIRYILDHHTWEKRVEAYDRLIGGA